MTAFAHTFRALATTNRFMMSAASPLASSQQVKQIRTNLASIRARIAAASSSDGADVKLIAVSKTKPLEMVLAAKDAGQVDFGENYVQELKEKAEAIPDGVRWHYIGALQTNKANVLLSVPNLTSVHSVDRVKLVHALERASERADRATLDVFVQVNVDEEATKAGCPLGEVDSVVDAVRDCSRLQFVGLMCIGRPGNTDAFRKLVEERQRIATRLDVAADSLRLSMGMSGDFEEAVGMGSTAVRVGSSIFGTRVYT